MIEDQAKQNGTGPYTKEEVITMLNSDVKCWDIEPYNMYGFNCIGYFYELSTGFYFEWGCASDDCVYCLMSCCSCFGSLEDQKKFNQNVVYTKNIGFSYIIPTNRKETALMNKGICKNKKQHKSLLKRLRTNLRYFTHPNQRRIRNCSTIC